MTAIRTKDDLRDLSRSLGMVNAAAVDMGLYDGDLEANTALDRIAATRLRELGMSEERIVAKFGYSPERFDDVHTPSHTPRG